MQEPAQDVAPELVRPERVRGAQAGEAVRRIRRLRRDGPEERSRERERPDGDEDRERGDAQPAHVRRIRGSIRVYARSTARLAATAIAATTTVRPVTSG